MRKANREELTWIADFLTDRFWGLELFSFLADGLPNARESVARFALSELGLFYEIGDVFLYDEQLTGVLAGVPADRLTMLRQLKYSLKARKILRDIPKEEAALLLKRSQQLAQLHTGRPWYRNYTRHAYYIAQIAVAREAKGTGVFRKLLTPVLKQCEKNGADVVLETFTERNVPIYEHFGFQLIETHQVSALPVSEYCMIRRSKKPAVHVGP